jgi:hypothetical protein
MYFTVKYYYFVCYLYCFKAFNDQSLRVLVVYNQFPQTQCCVCSL